MAEEQKPAAQEIAPDCCKTCKYFDAHSRAQEDKMHRGHCLRYPPTVNGVVGKSSVFPTTGSHDWCGEFKRAE
jgi:hypothetical protein